MQLRSSVLDVSEELPETDDYFFLRWLRGKNVHRDINIYVGMQSIRHGPVDIMPNCNVLARYTAPKSFCIP